MSNLVVEVLASVSVLIATINIVGGFLVTKRMLAMFQKVKRSSYAKYRVSNCRIYRLKRTVYPFFRGLSNQEKAKRGMVRHRRNAILFGHGLDRNELGLVFNSSYCGFNYWLIVAQRVQMTAC